jgi:hypothetical protein
MVSKMFGEPKTVRARLPGLAASNGRKFMECSMALMPKAGQMKFAPLLIVIVLLAGCGAAGGNVILGPNPGGGFYCPHNVYEGCAYP